MLHLPEVARFEKEIFDGLRLTNKSIPSKYFYDAQGSELFNQITRHPDYYLTSCELEILEKYKHDIAAHLHSSKFNLVELGPGEGVKTRILLQTFKQHKHAFTYIPVDISKTFLDSLAIIWQHSMPLIPIAPLQVDYTCHLNKLNLPNDEPNLVLFLGSSIGNFSPAETGQFLQTICQCFKPGDYLLLGMDLRKDIDILMRAYNDRDGITREFNLNLLRRINRELAADFDVASFRHYPTYNVHNGAMESYLLSQKKQTITVGKLGQKIRFEKIEPIHVESSYKYQLTQVENLAKDNGFEVVGNYQDERGYFLNTLWRIL